MQERQQILKEYRSHSNFSEVWQVGGDAYTAVAVAKKTGTGSWVVYNIFRDHLGTITHLKNGSTIDEYSFDACSVKLRFCKPCETKPLAEHIPNRYAFREGRRRDKDNWSYTLSGEPALFADRGFTGHEFLSDFNLYNMNGRLYDPVLGRFLSPDPYIADPSFTQSYNRYSYVLNNPLKYNDPTGELPLWALWGIASAGNWLFGGMDNWLNKGMSFKQSFSTANNPIVFSANYHPGSNSWSNTQASTHQLVGSMANAERGAHNHIAGFSGMGDIFEYPLYSTINTAFLDFGSLLANNQTEGPHLTYGMPQLEVGDFRVDLLTSNQPVTDILYAWKFRTKQSDIKLFDIVKPYPLMSHHMGYYYKRTMTLGNHSVELYLPDYRPANPNAKAGYPIRRAIWGNNPENKALMGFYLLTPNNRIALGISVRNREAYEYLNIYYNGLQQK